MIIRVKLFAAARDRVDAEEVRLEIPDQATIGDVRLSLLETHPQLEPILGHATFAVDQRYVDDAHVISTHHEIACIPPVSGG